MKKILILLTALLLGLTCAARADKVENAVKVEVIRMDGVSVVVFTAEEGTIHVTGEAMMAVADTSGFTMPGCLTEIGEEAFAGLTAEKVEVSESVVYIGSRAFADCLNLREFHIPAGVLEIEGDALAGCSGVTVYGSTQVAKDFAEANGFAYAAEGGGQGTRVAEGAAVLMPFMPIY